MCVCVYVQKFIAIDQWQHSSQKPVLGSFWHLFSF